MSAFPEHHEVRVTARQSVTTPFIPEELSPPSLLARELDKGLKGWTDFDKRVEEVGLVDGGKVRAAQIEADEMTVGETIIRKVSASNATVRRPRPATRRWS